MIVKSGAFKVAGNHLADDTYMLSIEHETIGRINGVFTAEEVTSVIEGLTDMILQQVLNVKEVSEDGRNGQDKG